MTVAHFLFLDSNEHVDSRNFFIMWIVVDITIMWIVNFFIMN